MTTIRSHYYQQFDADWSSDVPAEGYGGWKTTQLPLEPERTALVVMHAWNCGTRETYPGWHRAAEYIPRAQAICETIFPLLLDSVRKSPMPVFHVVSAGASYYQSYPGYARAVELSLPVPSAHPGAAQTAVWNSLQQFRRENVFVGQYNQADVQSGFQNLDFPPQARPAGDEGIAENSYQLCGLCRHHQINHLIYVGFAINWCLLLSPGGMAEMSQHGLICSTIRQAVTAVENRETARTESAKENALWRVALAFGFVYDMNDLIEFLMVQGGADE